MSKSNLSLNENNINKQLYVTMNNGIKIPIIALGVYQTPPKVTTKACYLAIKNGYRHIDSAKFYQNEAEVGIAVNKAIKDFNLNRDELFITSKYPAFRNVLKKNAKQEIIDTVKKAVNDMNIEYIDLYLLHSPHNKNLRLLRWEGLEECVKLGFVKSIGVSNYSNDHLKELLNVCKIKPVVNQIEVHPFIQRNKERKFCFDNQILIEAYCPLVQAQKFDNEILNKIAKNKNITVAQVLLRWSIQKGNIILPKTVNENRMIENFDVFNPKFELTKEEINEIDTLENNEWVCDWNPIDECD